MRQKSAQSNASVERAVGDIRRKTRRRHSMEKRIRIILEDFRGEESIASLCRREGIAESLYYNWSKEFLEAGKGALPVTQPARRPARR
jgi:transposase